MNQFEVIADAFGNVICNSGYVIDTTSATTQAYELDEYRANIIDPSTGTVRINSAQFLGGSGDSFEFTGTLDDPAPLGIYVRTEENIWQNRQFTLIGDPATGAELSDADDIVATITGAYTGFPDGTYTLTTYGEDTYNAGNAGTIDGEQEPIATAEPGNISVTASYGASAETIALTGNTYTFNVFNPPLGEVLIWTGTDWELQDGYGTTLDTGGTDITDPSGTYDNGIGDTYTVTVVQNVSVSTVDYAPATVQSGNYTRTDWCEWTSDDDPDFTITVNVDGTADISDATDIIATRSNEVFLQSQGVYNSTTYGADTYNDGAPFVVTIGYVPAMPLTLWVWLEIALNAGAFDGATGPFVGTSLPANSATKKVYPIYYSNGLGEAKQFTFGPIIWT